MSLQRKVMRQSLRDEYVAALADGMKQRAQTFKAKKGKGSYKRKRKYP